MKTKLAFVFAAVLLLVADTAVAQGPPQNSPAYHAVHHPQSVYNPNNAGAQQPLPPPQPTGYWEKTWGAIAPSPVGGVLGTAVGARSKEEATRIALQDCKKKGGGACEVRIAYHNQCAAMVLGDNIYRTASAGSIEDATKFGVALCSEEDTNCRVYYSACTEPIFHKY